MKLYKIVDAINAVLEARDEFDEEDLRAELAALDLQLNEKLENCWRAIRNFDSEAASLHEEAKRLKRRGEVLKNKTSRLKAYIGFCVGEGNDWSRPGRNRGV